MPKIKHSVERIIFERCFVWDVLYDNDVAMNRTLFQHFARAGNAVGTSRHQCHCNDGKWHGGLGLPIKKYKESFRLPFK